MALFHQLPSLQDPNDEEWEKLNVLAEARAKESPTASMPSLSHLSFRDYNEVYEPAEDTYLFLDALQYEFDHGNIPSRQKQDDAGPFVVLEIGCGSGAVSTFLRQQWRSAPRKEALHSIITDVNQRAIEVALSTDKANNPLENGENDDNEISKDAPTKLSPMEAIHCDLATPLLSRFQGQIDVVLFNPPYVPTEDDEVGCSDISAAWAGGTDGRRVIDRAVPQIRQLLRPDTGVAYLVTVDDNRPPELANLFQNSNRVVSETDTAEGETIGQLEPSKQRQLLMEPLLRRRSRNEALSIQKIRWS